MLLFPRGAVIRLSRPVECGQDLMLINKRTNRYAHCRVTNRRTTSDVNYVEVEFTHSMSDFWGMSFPRDAVSVAGAVAAFVAQPLTETSAKARGEAPAQAPVKALAAAAGAASPNPGGIASVAPFDSALTVDTNRPDPSASTDEQPTRPLFFEPRPMVCVPVCEPVADPEETAPAARADNLTAPPLRKWESRNAPESKRKRKRVRAGAAVALCAIVLGYRFYTPAEAALPLVPQVADSPSGGSLQTARAESGAADLAGASDGTTPPGAIVVSADAPEIESVEVPTQRVVLVSKMVMPVETATPSPHDAPELSPAPAGEPFSPAPGKAAGLLDEMGAAPPPPPQEPAPENPQKAADPLTPAHLVSSVQPIYPLAARQAQIQGDVVIEVKIDVSGNVTEMRVRSGPQALRAAATAAVAKWKYEPALLRGEPTISTCLVVLKFQFK